MKKMVVVAILAAFTAVGSPGEEDVAYAQVICTGQASQVGRGVVGTLGPDLIDCSESTAGVTIVGLAGDDDTLFGGAGDDLLYGGRGDDPLFGASGNDFCDGQEGKGDWASRTCELTVHVP